MAEPALVGVVVGGGIAILTTIANLTYNWFQSRSQRQFALRQQVYLDACAWAASGSEYLASLARLDLDDVQLARIIQASLAAYYRVHVVGEQSTVLAFTAASEYLGTQTAELMAARVQLRNRAARLEALQAEAERTSTYLAQATSIIDNIPKASPSTELLAAIPQMVAEFISARDRLQGVEAEVGQLQQDVSARQEELLRACMRSAVGYGECLMAANIAVRKELGIPLDEKGYREPVQAATGRAMGAVQEMVDRLKREK